MRTHLRRLSIASALIATSLAVIAVAASPVEAAPFTYTSVSTGYHRTCAVTSDGMGLCWGWNHSASLGTTDRSTIVLTPSVVSLPAGERFRHIEAGSYFTSCGITESGNVYCWGEGSAPNRFVLPGGSMVTQVSVGASQVCALTSQSQLFCHGDWNSGELGLGDAEYSHLPTRIQLPDSATPAYVSAGIGFTCVVATTGAAYCTGVNAAGQLGNGTTAPSRVFTRVALPDRIVLSSISAGLERACAVDTSGGGWCWGQNYNGAFGDGTYAHSRTPRPVTLPAGTTLVDLQTGWYHTCGITAIGSTLCWGSNDQGALGWGQTYGGTTIRTAALPSGVTARRLDVGLAGTCITSTDARVFCWGSNLRGSVGTGSTTAVYSPTQVLAVGTPDPSSPTTSSVSTHSAAVGGTFVPNGATSSITLLLSTSADMDDARTIGVTIPRSLQSNLAQLFAPVAFSASLAGLRPATTYFVATRSTNAFGSNISPVAVFTTLGDEPTVGHAAATDVSGESATLRATVDANLLDTAVNISYSTDSTMSNIIGTASFGTARGDSDTLLDTTITGLAPRTTYWARIEASNEVGTVVGDVFSFTTVGEAPTFIATSTSGSRRAGRVSVDIDAGLLRTAITVAIRPSGTTGTWIDQRREASGARSAFTVDFLRLAPATAYDVQITASNALGYVEAQSLSFITAGGAPFTSSAEVRDVADTSATLRTAVDSNDFATRVTLQIDTDESFSNYDEWFAGSLTAGSTTTISLDVSELVDSTAYFARFVAVNTKGSTISDTIAFTTTTPVGKLLRRRTDPVDPAPVVEPTPTDFDQPVAIGTTSLRIAPTATKKALLQAAAKGKRAIKRNSMVTAKSSQRKVVTKRSATR